MLFDHSNHFLLALIIRTVTVERGRGGLIFDVK